MMCLGSGKYLSQVIKYYAWEKPFMKKVEETRKEEVISHHQNIIDVCLWMLFLRLAVS